MSIERPARLKMLTNVTKNEKMRSKSFLNIPFMFRPSLHIRRLVFHSSRERIDGTASAEIERMSVL